MVTSSVRLQWTDAMRAELLSEAAKLRGSDCQKARALSMLLSRRWGVSLSYDAARYALGEARRRSKLSEEANAGSGRFMAGSANLANLDQTASGGLGQGKNPYQAEPLVRDRPESFVTPAVDTLTAGVAAATSSEAWAGSPGQARAPADAPIFDHPPSPQLPVEELVRQRVARFAQRRKHEESRALLPVKMPDDLPLGILIYGDPHTDDEGTDLGLLFEHADLVAKTTGLWAASVGDYQNNWVGRLARLYANQSTTASEAWTITEHWIERHRKKWLFLVCGNHDAWCGANDPLSWIATRQGSPPPQEWEIRLELQFPGGHKMRIKCAHDFPGNSMWNPAHAPAKALRLGQRDDVAICGHRHHMAYQPVIDPETGGLLHAIRVGSYKAHDEYARKLGHSGGSAPSVLLTIDPRAPLGNHDRIKLHWDPAAGADYLTWMRSRR